MILNFPRQLFSLRRQKGVSQREAASALGISQALLSHYENGAREPGLEFIVRAASYYGVSTDTLLKPCEPLTEIEGNEEDKSKMKIFHMTEHLAMMAEEKNVWDELENLLKAVEKMLEKF